MGNISRDRVLERLETGFIGRNMLCFETVGSTMDVARHAACSGAQEGMTVVAEEQTQGRARLGRSWINPVGVLAVSIILRPPLSQLLGLTIVSSLGTSRCILKSTGIEARIKWPNDVLIKGRKVSGILSESGLRGQTVDWAVVGIGINVNFNPEDYPEISKTATSLSHEVGETISMEEVLLHLLQEFEGLYLALRNGEPIHKEWEPLLETLGKRVKVTSGATVSEGLAQSVDSDGSLLLRHRDGTLTRVVAGEVTLRDQPSEY